MFLLTEKLFAATRAVVRVVGFKGEVKVDMGRIGGDDCGDFSSLRTD